MNFKIVFEKTGDEIPFIVIDNQKLFEHFINHVQGKGFFDYDNVSNKITKNLKVLSNSIGKVNDTLKVLPTTEFELLDNITDYLNQDFLNRTHCDWAKNESLSFNIDELRESDSIDLKKIGNLLHNLYPDNRRNISTSEILYKLGLLNDYKDINDNGVHAIEHSFNKINYSTDKRYDMFENKFFDEMTTSNSFSNFSFTYTYVGRRYYNKFVYFDDTLQYDDHYNFQHLEETFSLSLRRPETIPFSKEYLEWSNKNNVKPIGMTAPIANIPNLMENLTKYRTIVYNNSIQKNKCTIEV